MLKFGVLTQLLSKDFEPFLGEILVLRHVESLDVTLLLWISGSTNWVFGQSMSKHLNAVLGELRL